MKSVVFSLMIAVAVCLASFYPALESQAAFSIFSPHKKVKEVDGKIQIPLTKINDGKAHHFKYETKGSTIKFFVVKSRDGIIRAAFDACDVCFPARKGYTQDGDFMICNNCGRRFHTSRINVVEGGCNPAPLNRAVVGNYLVINVSDVIPGSRFF